MRLWFRVFILTLTLTLVGTQLTAYIMTYRNFRTTLEKEQERLISEHRLYMSGVENRLVYLQLETGDFAPKVEDIDASLGEIAAYDNETDGILIYRGESLIFGRNAEELTAAVLKTGIEPVRGDSKIVFTDVEQKTIAVCCSEIDLDYNAYRFYNSYDVSAIYNNYHQAISNIRKISYLVAIGIAVVLLITVAILMRPLDTLQKEIKQIGMGNYSRRVSVKGSPELVEMAENINEMASLIEENVGSIQAIADSRKQFIDNLAHEMKTPLTSIMGFADIIRIQRSLKDKQRVEYAGIILEEAKRLRSLSGKLLQLATSDKVQLDISEVSIEELFKEIYTSVIPMVVNHEMSLVMSCEPGAVLDLDRELIKSLIYNLIDNAVKASKAGSEIRLDCTIKDGKTAISVIDHGSGMPAEHIKKVTEPFYMVDKSRSRKAGGAGLGLALCVEIAKQHNAKLKISSEEGKGTIVMVVFDEKV